MTDNLPSLTIAEAGRRFRSGALRPEALVEALLARIDARDGRVGAWVSVWREEALAAARNAGIEINAGQDRGPLHGIPIGIKDLIDVAGEPTLAGAPELREGHRATQDAPVVTRLRAAGAVLLGKTQTHPLAMGTLTPTTRNPWDLERIPGGSSGGSAAALAAGMCLGALGSDTGGSIRLPAALCGVTGLKPTYGRVSRRGIVPLAWTLDHIGPLAGSVEDTALMLQVLAGYDADDARSRRRRVALSPPDWEPGHLRTGLLPDLAAIGVQPEVIEVFEAALAKMPHALGERRTVDFDDWHFARTRRAGLLLMESEMLATYAADLADAARPVSNRFRRMLDYAANKSAADYAVADRVLDAATLKMRRLFAQVDVLVLPTTPQGAFPLDGPEPDSVADLTSFASLAGCPAISLPMGTLPNGLPIGLQLVGARGSDLRLLELAAACAATLDAGPAYPVIA
jgi:Asp-tRNA(Asn)/Glu-tRNA(Gln) amidotransferase A subunit family amidase